MANWEKNKENKQTFIFFFYIFVCPLGLSENSLALSSRLDLLLIGWWPHSSDKFGKSAAAAASTLISREAAGCLARLDVLEPLQIAC